MSGCYPGCCQDTELNDMPKLGRTVRVQLSDDYVMTTTHMDTTGSIYSARQIVAVPGIKITYPPDMVDTLTVCEDPGAQAVS